MLKNVYLAGGVRTPFGALNGALSGLSAAELGSIAVRNTLERTDVGGADVDEVIIGNVIGAGVGQNIARQVSLGAGIPQTVGATTVNKVCGSSMHAVILASQAIQCGDAGLVVAGGCESMSNAPYLLKKARGGYRMADTTTSCDPATSICALPSTIVADPLNRAADPWADPWAEAWMEPKTPLARAAPPLATRTAPTVRAAASRFRCFVRFAVVIARSLSWGLNARPHGDRF